MALFFIKPSRNRTAGFTQKIRASGIKKFPRIHALICRNPDFLPVEIKSVCFRSFPPTHRESFKNKSYGSHIGSLCTFVSEGTSLISDSSLIVKEGDSGVNTKGVQP